jgi:hypothetical protein
MDTTTRAAFGHDHYLYIGDERLQVGMTRTLRPVAGESSAAFRQRVAEAVHALRATEGTLALDEELRDGVLVQVTLRLQVPPTLAGADDPCPVGPPRSHRPRGQPG